MKTFSIFSAALCVFGVFVAASPIASSEALVARDDLVARSDLVARTTEKDIIDIVVKLDIDLDNCHKKWEDKCDKHGCSQQDIKDWQLEVSVIIDACITVLTPKVVGFVFVDISVFISLFISICLKLNLCLTFLLGKCGLLGGLLSFLLNLIFGLLGDLKIKIGLLITLLGPCCPNIVLLQVLIDGCGGLIGALLKLLL